MRHKHADLIIAWAEGAEIQVKTIDSHWINNIEPNWRETNEYRIKPKEPEWWENIPKHGILVKKKSSGSIFVLTRIDYVSDDFIPLTNEEIERFKR